MKVPTRRAVVVRIALATSANVSVQNVAMTYSISANFYTALGLGSKVWPTPEVALETDFTGLVKL